MSKDSRWYLVQTKVKQEKVAEINLERQQYTCYLPMLRRSHRDCKGYRFVVEPMFSRYLFIALDVEGDDFSPIRSTRGVQQMIRFGAWPASVPDEVVECIRQQQAASFKLSTAQPTFEAGQKVQLQEGPLAGYEAIFEAPCGKKRANILLQMAGQYSRMQVGMETLQGVA